MIKLESMSFCTYQKKYKREVLETSTDLACVRSIPRPFVVIHFPRMTEFHKVYSQSKCANITFSRNIR